MEKPLFNRALDQMINLCDTLNRFIVTNEPWKLAKEDSKSDELDDVLYGAAKVLGIIGRMMLPFMPRCADDLFTRLGIKNVDCDPARWETRLSGNVKGSAGALFPRMEEKKIDEIKNLLSQVKKINPG